MKHFMIILGFIICNVMIAQEDENKNACPAIENKKAVKLYEKAQDKKKYKKPERIQLLKEATEIEPNYAEAYLQIGQELVVNCKLNNSSFAPTVPSFKKAVEICPQIHSSPYYYIGFNFYEEMKNDSAIFWLEKFIKFRDEDEKKFDKDYDGQIFQAKEMIKYAKKENELKKKTVPFNPIVVKGISTVNSEYLPIYFAR
jgi:tetratricopeptide (TPR) repeat protein